MRGDRRRAATLVQAGHLGLTDERDAVLGALVNAHRAHELDHLAAFGDGGLHFLGKRGHVLDAATVDAAHALGAQALGGAGGVHGHVAAADDDHVFALQVVRSAVGHAMQERRSAHHAFARGVLDSQIAEMMRADGDVDGIVTADEVFPLDILADLGIKLDLDAQR